MKVAVDSGPTTSGHSVRGVGLYARELISALEKNKSKYTDLQIYYKDFEKDNLSEYDVVHKTSFSPFFQNKGLDGANKIILTIHDLIPLIYPKQYPPGIKGMFRFKINRSLIKKNVSLVVTESETSKKDIIRFLDYDPDKIRVVYLAAGINARMINDREKLKKVAERYKLPTKFVFYLGDVNYNKNVPTLIKACSHAGLPLVIAGKQASLVYQGDSGLDSIKGPRDWARYIFGKPHPEHEHFESLKKMFIDEKVILLGYVSDTDLVSIFNLATLYVQPSFYEGFGLPVLQAMSCGVPVIVSKTNALVELSGDAAYRADPYDYMDFSGKIVKLISDSAERVNLVRKGLNRVKEYSWDKTAREMLDIYRSI